MVQNSMLEQLATFILSTKYWKVVGSCYKLFYTAKSACNKPPHVMHSAPSELWHFYTESQHTGTESQHTDPESLSR